MKLLFVVFVLCTILHTFAQPAEKKSDSQSTTSNANAQKVADQKKHQSATQESAKDQEEKVSSGLIRVSPARRSENLKVAESMYHSLPMPFVHYPFPFVNSYTTRYFPYGYAGLGFDNVLPHGGLGYGGLGGLGGLGYAYGYGGWF